jgi:NAD(P)H-hydrate epimerase
MAIPAALYSVAQARRFDELAIAGLGGEGYTLMRRAGEGALRALRSRWPRAQRVCVATGGGNNGGDGFVLARFARAAGLEVEVCALVPVAQLRGDARRAADEYVAGGGSVRPFEAAVLREGEVLVDALLGIGPAAPVREPCRGAIEALNASGRPIMALDLPSGLHGDSGRVLGVAVRAEFTITFVVPKAGLYLGDGPEYAGRVEFDPLEVEVPAGEQPAFECLAHHDIVRALPARGRAAHKGDFGRVLLIGGGPGMPGAPRLAGEAALRCGAGLVTVATEPANVTAVVAGRPELMCLGVRTAQELAGALAAASVVAVGPGLGTGEWSRNLCAAALASGKPLVLDADALNFLAASSLRVPDGTILTPHPGEAGRLLGVPAADIQADRPAALARLVAQRGGIVVLKGAGTLVGTAGRTPALCTSGNPGMAAPGMGDVLTGAVAGILAQCRDPWLAARAAVQAHALAGDALARGGTDRGLLALDLAEQLTQWVNHPS